MCECGCAERMVPALQFPGPSDTVYALGLYPGCENCDNPAGVVLYHTTPAGLKELTPWSVYPVAWDDQFVTWREFTIPVIGSEGLLKAMREATGVSANDRDSDVGFALDEARHAYIDAAQAEFGGLLAIARAAASAAEEGQTP